MDDIIDAAWDQKQQDEQRMLSEDPAYAEWLDNFNHTT
jgi:hypothetical protein